MNFKSEVIQVFKEFHNLINNHFRLQIKNIKVNDIEYISHNMMQYLSTHWIMHQTSCVGTPQQNSTTER